MMTTATQANADTETLKIYLIRPSRYDDDGYVLRHVKGVIPSNTLNTLQSLNHRLASSGELGEVKLESEIVDEAVQITPFRRIFRENRRKGTRVLVALSGVQTNQCSRALDLARRFRSGGVDVMIGGFHVSGVNALLPGTAPEIKEFAEMGAYVVRGEIDSCWGDIIKRFLDGDLPLWHDMLRNMPDLSVQPIPAADKTYMNRFAMPDQCTIDASRGCPFNCSFCTIINVQGRKMRGRSPERILATMREQYDKGVKHYFFTDDNFARHPLWEDILDGMIEMREQGQDITFMMQVDTQAVRIPRFVDKAAEAGCTQVFIGLESINAENLKAAGKGHNQVSQFRDMVDMWRERNVVTQCGYIVGFPHDTPESIRDDVRRLRDEVGIDVATFFILMPLPGSADHAEAVRAGVKIDEDLNNFDSTHVLVDHPNMTREELKQAYYDAWREFYTPEHMKRCLKRHEGDVYWSLFYMYTWYRNSVEMGEHPMMSGFWRKRDRTQRRPGFKRHGLIAHQWLRLKSAAHQLNMWRKLLPELQELWLATRTPDPNEGRLRSIAKSALSFQPSVALANTASRFHRLKTSRVDLTDFWSAFRRLRWIRGNPLLAPWKAMREWALATHFLIQLWRGVESDKRGSKGMTV